MLNFKILQFYENIGQEPYLLSLCNRRKKKKHLKIYLSVSNLNPTLYSYAMSYDRTLAFIASLSA